MKSIFTSLFLSVFFLSFSIGNISINNKQISGIQKVNAEKTIEEIDEEEFQEEEFIEEELEEDISEEAENTEDNEEYIDYDENTSEDEEEVDANDEEIQEIFSNEQENTEEFEKITEEIYKENYEYKEEEINEESENLDENDNFSSDDVEIVELEKSNEENIDITEVNIQIKKEEVESRIDEIYKDTIDQNESLSEKFDDLLDDVEEVNEVIDEIEDELEELDIEDSDLEEVIEDNEIIYPEGNEIDKKESNSYSGESNNTKNKGVIIPSVTIPFIEAILPEDEYFVDLGERVFFESYESELGDNTQIFWNFGDGKFVKNKKSTSHLYKEVGEYKVTLKLVEGKKISETIAYVYVATKTIVLLSDGSATDEEINQVKESAKLQNAYLKIISIDNEINNFASEEKLTKALKLETQVLKKADYYVSLTKGVTGVNAYNRAFKANNIESKNKQLVVLNTKGGGSKILAKSLQNNVGNLPTQSVIVTGLQATPEIFASEPEQLFDKLKEKNIEYSSISNSDIAFIHPLNFLSHIVSMLLAKNIAPNVVMLILMLPIAATIVVFFRQIIGLTSFGIFTPALIAVTFLATGLSYGLLMFFVILIAGVGLRTMIQNVKLLSIPRISLVMIFVSFIMILLLGAGAYLDLAFVYSIGAFPMLILAFVIEKFVTTQHEKGFKDAVILLLSTLFIAIVSYFVMNWQFLQTLLMAYAEIIFILVVLNILLGKWTGMRLIEYIRFKVLINKTEK